MLRLSTPCMWSMVIAMAACHSDLRTARCDPFRTPRIQGSPVSKEEEKSSHAPYSAGDCTACHLFADGAATFNPRVIRPVNGHCLSCHRELFRSPPRGHPPEQSFCTSCHDPHASRQRSLLRDEDQEHACLDYPPPIPEKASAPPDTMSAAAPAAANKAPAAAKRKRAKKTRSVKPAGG